MKVKVIKYSSHKFQQSNAFLSTDTVKDHVTETNSFLSLLSTLKVHDFSKLSVTVHTRQVSTVADDKAGLSLIDKYVSAQTFLQRNTDKLAGSLISLNSLDSCRKDGQATYFSLLFGARQDL